MKNVIHFKDGEEAYGEDMLWVIEEILVKMCPDSDDGIYGTVKGNWKVTFTLEKVTKKKGRGAR